MRIRIDGREVAQPSKYPLGLVYEAEKASALAELERLGEEAP